MAPKGGAECTFAPVPHDRLAVNLESPVPTSLPAGGALAGFCSGTASDGSSPASDLQRRVDLDTSAGDDRGEPGHTADLIAVCMATFDPDRELLVAQLDSLRGQTDTDWLCVISDDYSSEEHFAELLSIVGEDPRFFVSR